MICLNTISYTPFWLDDSKIYLENEVIGDLEKLENDIVEICYFRKRKKVLVLNTNNRVSCIGKCKFCGTRYLTPRINKKILSFREFLKWFEKIEKIAKVKISQLEEICLNTGLFSNERNLITHLLTIYNAAVTFGFSGEIKYIGSQLRKRQNLQKVSTIIPTFSYYFTLETLEQRKLVDKRKKFTNFHVKKIVKLFEYLKHLGFETSLLYVLGLDSISTVFYAFQKFKKVLTRFPVVNLFQAYHPSHENLRRPEAEKLDYFLEARKLFEKIFEDTNLRPKLWENYRGLWYTTFKGERLGGQYLQTFIRGY